MQVDVAIITALLEERNYLQQATEHLNLDWEHHQRVPFSSREYWTTRLQSGLTVASACASGMGQIHSAVLTCDVIRDLQPRLIILTGISGGIKKQRRSRDSSDHSPAQKRERSLGDLLIPSQVVYYEHKKMGQDGPENRWKSLGLSEWRHRFVTAASEIKWAEVHDGCHILSGSHSNKHWKPEIHEGPILTGEKVVANQAMINELLKDWPQASGVEMEAAGVAQAANEQRDTCQVVVVKGISDFADNQKDDLWRPLAARCAATLVFDTLNHLTDIDTLPQRREIQRDERLRGAISVMAPALSSGAGFRHGLVRHLVESMIDEIAQVSNAEYNENLSTGAQFLIRAKPIFRPATTVLATSVDTVSTFWTDGKNREAAVEYLQAQSKSTTRLFVFSMADSVHEYGRILDQHRQEYGKVCVTTLDHYRSLLQEWGVPQEHVSVDTDFAVLDYAESANDSPSSFLATLDDHRLIFRSLSDGLAPQKVNWVERYRRAMTRFADIPEGSMNKSVLKWSHRLWKNRDWPEMLEKLFGGDRPREAYHVVFFTVNPSERGLPEKLNHIYHELRKRQRQGWNNRFELRGVWIGRRAEWNPVPCDGRYRGALRVNAFSDVEYVLVMRFGSADGLLRYYQDEEHSKLRQELFTFFDERLGTLYDLCSGDGDHPSAALHTSLLYECIESLAARSIQRLDFSDARDIEEMTNEEPYEPLTVPGHHSDGEIQCATGSIHVKKSIVPRSPELDSTSSET